MLTISSLKVIIHKFRIFQAAISMFQKLNYGIQLRVTKKTNDACVHVVPVLRLQIGWSCCTMLSWCHNSAHSGVWALRLALTLPVYCMSRFYLLMAAYKSGGERLWQRAGNAYLTLHFPLFYIAYMLHILKHPSHFFPTSPPPSLWEQQTSLFKFIDESCCCSYLPHNLFCDVIQSSVELYWKQSIQSHM